MDPIELLAIIKAIADAATAVADLVEKAKQTGDPLPQELQDQLTRLNAANDRIHQIAGV